VTYHTHEPEHLGPRYARRRAYAPNVLSKEARTAIESRRAVGTPTGLQQTEGSTNIASYEDEQV